MKSSLLHYRLRPVVFRLWLIRWFQESALVAAAAAAVLYVSGWLLGAIAPSLSGKAGWGIVSAALGIIVWRTVVRWSALEEFDAAALAVEQRHPELKGLLLTAVKQRPGSDGRYHFLQQHLIDEAITHGVRNPWPGSVPAWRIAAWTAAPLAALVLCTLSLRTVPGTFRSNTVKSPVGKPLFSGVEVTPGDTVMERGSSLVVLARFGKAPAQGAELVLSASGEPERRIPLVRSLSDPVFGGRVPELVRDLSYRVEYAGSRTREFTVKLYELPRLEHANVNVEFPAYTHLPAREIKDTRRLSAVEGSRMSWQFLLNKPVRSAVLVQRGAVTNRIELATATNSATLTWAGVPVTTNATYELRLTDADGRTNRAPAQFVIEALPNRVPELKLASPRGDLKPSPLEEVRFDGTVWDDFGVNAFGIAVTRPGSETQFIELGRDVAGREKKAFHHLLRLEDLGVKPDQLLAWFVWMDDVGPDGAVRRTTGDLYFAEVRPFDEVFREAQGGGEGDESGGGGGGGGGGGDQGGKLAELQKQVINATWKLQRERGSRPASGGKSGSDGSTKPASKTTSGTSAIRSSADRSLAANSFMNHSGVMGQVAPQDGASGPTRRAPRRTAGAATNTASAAVPRGGTGRFEDDLKAVQDGAEQALEQARESMEQAQSPDARALWKSAIAAMERSLEALRKSDRSPQSLAEALVDEQAAYQTLLQLRARETEVTRGRQRSRGQGQGGSANQRQIDQLDLTQSENRYETQRSAQSQQSAERRAQLQILSRLQELAHRQQDVNERLKELQTALQEARTPEEREELQRRLKRLQEEQRQMLSDVDEVQQRMNRPEAQSQMAESKQQLEQAREELQKAAEATGEGRVSQALASGSRAEQKLEKMRDELRRDSSNAFSEELRQLRNEAREMQRREEEIARQLRNQSGTAEKRLTDSGGAKEKLLKDLAEQKRSITNLVSRATQISEQSEASEPLLSRQLYDTLRNYQQQDPGSVSRIQEQLLQSGELTRGLNDRLQEISGNESARAIDATAELVRQGLGARAGVGEQEARKGIDALKNGVERAASRILGDDTEALRMAAEELDALSGELEREMTEARQREPGRGNGTANGAGSSTNSLAGNQQGSRTNSAANGARGAGRGQPSDPDSADGQDAQASASGQGQSADGATAGANSRQTQARADQSQSQGQGQQPGQGERQGRRPGQRPGQGQGQVQGQSDTQDQASADGQSPGAGEAQGQGQGQNPGRGQRRSGANGDRSRQQASAPREGGQPGGGGGGGGGANGEGELNPLDLGAFGGADNSSGGGGRGGGGRYNGGPLTGADFAPWADRLRDAEDLVDMPELRSGIASARERARLARLEYRREGKKPEWAVVELQVLKPLVEVRRQIREELGRRNTQDPLAPIDRDAVPTRFADQVRRYYETLGRDSKSASAAGEKGKAP